jgi:hypothetical protein
MKPMISIPRNTDLSRYPIFYFFYTYLWCTISFYES